MSISGTEMFRGRCQQTLPSDVVVSPVTYWCLDPDASDAPKLVSVGPTGAVVEVPKAVVLCPKGLGADPNKLPVVGAVDDPNPPNPVVVAGLAPKVEVPNPPAAGVDPNNPPAAGAVD